ncbi:MAG: NAD(P)-binding domain-containing protein [Acetobacteraceae bacterium]|nr:NAD(P)-binding domain-containing protein [Acetobacteraceae bacterium]
MRGALLRAGHEVAFGVRKPDPGRSEQQTIRQAVANADAVILAVPFGAVADVAAAGGGLAGKIVIDATNPLGMVEGGLGLTIGHTTSGAEQVAALMPQAHVFKAFNQTGLENMGDARPYPGRPVMFVAGDQAEGKVKVLRLVEDTGFEAVDIGGLGAARLLEPLAMLWIELARKGGMGADFAFALVRKNAV